MTASSRPQKQSEGTETTRVPVFEAVILLLVPASLAVCALFQFDQTALASMAVAIVALVIYLAGFERSAPALRQIMPIVVLASFAVAGRILFAPFPDVKPVSAICIVAGAVFGRRSGFMVGMLAALCSNFFFGQGPWTPWQMYAWGMVGWCAGWLASKGLFSRRSAVLAYGFASGLLYGFILNSWYLVGYVHPITWESAVAAYGAGFALDIVHCCATVAFLLLVYVPWSRKLERIKVKYALAR